MLALDTNLVVRYLTGDHPEQYLRATEVIEGQPVFIATTVILEAEWVLRSTYRLPAASIIDRLRAFAGLPTVTVEGGPMLAQALDLAARGVDFADALHLGASARCQGLVTFDCQFVRAARAAGAAGVREA